MKKLFLFFGLVVLGTIGAFGQYLVSPIKKVIPNHVYTVEELKEFINSNDTIVGPWCETFLRLVQDGLTKCDEDLFITKGTEKAKETVLFIIDNYCIETKRDLPAGFINSGKTRQNTIKFVIDEREFKNMDFLTFKFGSCEKDIVKMNCFNEPDLPERKIQVPKFKSETVPEQTPQTEPEEIQGSPWEELEEEPECLVKRFTADPDTIKKGEKSILLWEVENASYIKISGIDTNLKLIGNMEVRPLFRGKQKSAMYTMDVYKHDILSNADVICKTQMVFVYKLDNPWLFKNVPNWAEFLIGTAAAGIATGFIAHGDGIWYGQFGRDSSIQPEGEFNPVDANPQAMLQKLGITISF